MASDMNQQDTVDSDKLSDIISWSDTSFELDEPFDEVIPIFFTNSLRDACRIAFDSATIDQRRPVLVYISNDSSELEDSFYSTMCCSSNIVAYLNMNYVIWPWKFMGETADTLDKIWQDLFSTSFSDNFSSEEFPLLIGITRLFEYRKNGEITSEYQFDLLVKNNILTHTQLVVDTDNLFDELYNYKEKCEKIELDLSFDFVEKTRLCWDIIYETAQYLPLNDSISAFSINVLSMLKKSQFRFQLSDPNDSIVKMIRPKIESEKVVSLHLDKNQLNSMSNFILLSKLQHITSITLVNPINFKDYSKEYAKCFPKLICFSIYYDRELNYREFEELLILLPGCIRQFKIHCTEILDTRYYTSPFYYFYDKILKIESFLLHTGHGCLPLKNESRKDNDSYILMRRTSWVRIIKNIQYFYFHINDRNIELFWNVNRWIALVHECSKLKKIVLQISQNTYHGRQFLIDKAKEIQLKLRAIRETIVFRIQFL
ncbi:hypothetical protein I4U23_016406 [Adineta vaga]|nr:hypothetical protein I4U23_016406 [Adineta vaga]